MTHLDYITLTSDHGSATAGDGSIVIVSCGNGTATAGDSGFAVSDAGRAVVGERGVAIGRDGSHATVSGCMGAALVVVCYDSDERPRVHVAYVGESAPGLAVGERIEAEVPYRCVGGAWRRCER